MRRFVRGITGGEIAASIGPGLAKAAVAVKLDGESKDLTRPIEQDAKLAILTRDAPEAVEIIRHDAAHVMAEAVKELYPETQVTFGPATETGFYYDFARATPFTPEDLVKIEERMHEIVDRDEKITREEWERDRAVEFFAELGEKYKAEWIHEIPKDEAISLYRQGNFVDLCAGPHLPSTGKLGHAFKLTKVAGAYWRGDARNAQLQRVYGTAWANEKELKQYLFQLEEAEKRDHRRLGRELDLFHQQEEAVGAVFWHPKGWTLYRTIENYVRRAHRGRGLCRSEDAATRRPLALGSLRPLGEIPRAHVHHRGRRSEARPRGEADELSLPCADLPPGAAFLSRAAAAHGRVRLMPSQRAVGRAARHHARARLHPGRRAYLLHRRPDHCGERRLLRIAAKRLSRFRLPRGAASNSPTARRPAPAPTRSGTRPKAL